MGLHIRALGAKRTYLKILINLNNLKMKMIIKKNPLSGDWLCWIPGTALGYYFATKKQAKMFRDKINSAFDDGKITLLDGRIIKEVKPNLNK